MAAEQPVSGRAAQDRTADRSRVYQNAREGMSSHRPVRHYDVGRMLGNGSFGVVCEARCLDTGEAVAIKQVLQDPRYKNRELDIMKQLSHPNVVALKDYFYTEEKEGERYLNVVMEYVPETVYKVIKTFFRSSSSIPVMLVKVYAFQMCRSLGYLHGKGICHRDIKPQNLLVNTQAHVLKLCDFGSAKRLIEGEPSVSYICSRFYRAPELMLGATEYTPAIDVWSIGCVLAELLLGKPLFAGETSVDQLVKIIQVLGTPTREQMSALNPNYTDFKFPEVKARDWRKVFGGSVPEEALDLIDKMLKYDPTQRVKPFEALLHPFFKELRDPNMRLPGGKPLPDLFNISGYEVGPMESETAATWRNLGLAAAKSKVDPPPTVRATANSVTNPAQSSLGSLSSRSKGSPAK
eukprot:Selendium_serpulae@DN6244_c0_g3_i1.p1